jgi:hypothetical protein
MARRANPASRRELLRSLVQAEASEVCTRYGPAIGWDDLLRLLQDRVCVHFPCELSFDATPLLPGEFAHALPKGPKPEDGFTIYVHPTFEQQRHHVPYLVLHQLALVNHSDAASADDAELYGSLALGLSEEEYRSTLCRLSGQLGESDPFPGK